MPCQPFPLLLPNMMLFKGRSAHPCMARGNEASGPIISSNIRQGGVHKGGAEAGLILVQSLPLSTVQSLFIPTARSFTNNCVK